MKKINYKWGIIAIVIYVIVVFAMLHLYNNSKGVEGYLILSEEAIYYKSDEKWTRFYENIASPETIVVKTENRTYDLAITIIKRNIQYYQNQSQIKLNEPLKIAYSKDLNLKFKEFEIQEIHKEQAKKFNDILQTHGIIGYEHLDLKQLSYDFNADGITENIYFATNLFLESTHDKVFSFAYYIHNNQPVYLIEQVGSLKDVYELCIPTVKSIVDLNDDKKDELILSCEYFNNIGVDYSFYQYESNEFTRMKGV